MSGASKPGLEDQTAASRPTVFQPGLFAGRAVMVSAAGSGIGRDIAALYARLGAKLIICGEDRAGLQTCADGLRGLGSPDVLVQAIDTRESAQVEQRMDEAWQHCGGIDVLVNSIGRHHPQRALDYSSKGWKEGIAANLNGTWYMMHAVARRWRESGRPGNILNLVATFQRGMPGLANSCAAGAAVTYLSKTVAVEWAEYRIRVNCVAPGVIAKAGSIQYSTATVGALTGANPMKHAGQLQDIAEAVVYLTAPSGAFVTGELLTVDGGGSLWGETWAIAKPDYFKFKS